MAKHPELLLLVIALSLTLITRYGSSLKSKPITVPPKPPKRFFPERSPVYDHPFGNLDPVVDLLAKEQLVFMMYYAPWCSKSMSVRAEFHKAAKHMQNQVKFVAVNCWWPEGHCRKRYKFLMFPILFVYHTHLDGHRYIGLPVAEHMVKFLEDIIYPLTAFHEETQIKDFVARHDTAVLGYFDFNTSPQPPGYEQFYFASMRVIENDPFHPIRFGVVFKKSLASLYSMTESKELIMLRVTNSTLKYSWKFNFTCSEIVKWTFRNRQKPLVRWVVPLGVKSLILSKEIVRGPAVIAFYVVNPLFDVNQPYHVMKDLALNFYNCGQNTSLNDAVVRWRKHVVAADVHYHDVVEFCDKFRRQRNAGLYDFKCCITMVNYLQHLSPQAQNVCEYCIHKQSQTPIQSADCLLNMESGPHHKFPKWSAVYSNFCRNSVENYNANEHLSLCCKLCSTEVHHSPNDFLPFSFRSGKRKITDNFVWQSLDNLHKQLCKRLTLQKMQGLSPYTNLVEFNPETLPENFTGLGCQTNKTLNFYAMDATHHWVFAKRLGVDVAHLSRQPAVVIFDKESEGQYLLKENFTANNVATFIVNFTMGQIRRSLRTSSIPVPLCDNLDTSVCITEVTTQTFQDIVMDLEKDVVLLVYSEWCGFCLSVSHIYLSLARYFQTSNSIIFARINGDSNDLPWEFTVETYPIILFFPAHRKSDSVVFPESVSITLPNLIRFVLQHSTQRLRMETALGVCSKSCIQRNKQYSQQIKHILAQKKMRLRSRFTHTAAIVKDLKPAQRRYKEITLAYYTRRLQEIHKEMTVVGQLYEFLMESNGVYIEHSKLQSFLAKHKLLSGDGSNQS